MEKFNKRLKKLEHWQIISTGLAVYDALAAFIAFFLALWFRFDCEYTMIPKEYLSACYRFAPIYMAFLVFVFWRLHLYNSIWRFASYSELLRVSMATAVTFVFQCAGITLLFERMPFSYYFFGILIQFTLTLGIRFAYRFILLERERRRAGERHAQGKRVLLIGAGRAGQMILKDIRGAKEAKDYVCCFIDDNPNKWGRYVDGVLVEGGRDDILSCVEKYKIEKIFVAIPSAAPEEKRDILNICKETGCELKSLPGVYQLLTGEVKVSALRDVDVEDLLGREPIKVNTDEICEYLQGKVVLVTGGGGSIGSELVRKIAEHRPKQLIVFELYENNAIGTYKTAFAAMANGTERFVLISTDKAVNPTNIMGASKRLCEMIIQAFDAKIKEGKATEIPQLFTHWMQGVYASEEVNQRIRTAKTEFVAVRFGNVLGSNGSVIPLFKKQIAEGGPVTVTHPDIIRYFMTIPEAVNLVLQAGTYAKGGIRSIIETTKVKPYFTGFACA